MAVRQTNRSLGALLFALILSLVILGGVFVGGRLTGTAQAATGDLGAWTGTTPLTFPTWAFASAASPSYVYISGGEITATGHTAEFTGTMRAAINPDGSLGPWENQTLLSDARIDHGMVYTETSGNKCLYVVGGFTSQTTRVTDSVEYATVGPDGTIGTWAQTSAMNSKRAHFGVAAYDGRLYAMGGLSDNLGVPTSTVELAAINSDCSLGAWQTTTPMTATHSANRAFVANGFLYSTGDMSDTLAAGVQYAPINPVSGTLGAWATTSSMNQKRADHAVIASTRAGYAYALGGIATSPFSRTATVERAALNSNGTLGTWSFVSAFPSPNEDMAFAQANGRIYMLGGSSGAITNTVYFSAIDGAGPPNLSGSTKQVSSAVATPGQTVTYTLVLSNTGNGPASARVTDTLPVSVTYASGSVSGAATYDSGSRSIRWSGAVPVGTPVSITYRAVITSPLGNGLLITNTATINDGNGAIIETAPVTTTVTSAPDLSTSAKTVKRPISSPGGTVSYNIVVSNTGTMNTAARVTDTLPLSLTYIANTLQSTMGSSLYDGNTGSIYWVGPALVSVPVTISYQAKVPATAASGTTITNTATIHGNGSAPRETAPVTVTVASNPSRIGWQNLGLYGIRAEDLEIDTVADVVYVASNGGTGIYRSLDGGQTWLPSSTFAGCLRLQINRSTGTVYANCRPGIDRGGLFQSTDHGATWTALINRALYPAFGDSQSRDIGLAGSTLYVAGVNGDVWVSTDAGTTWTRHAAALSGAIQALAVDPATSTTVYAATSDKAFKSINSGETWTEITPPFGGSEFRSVAVNPHNPSIVFVGTGIIGSKHLYKSTDSGQTWTDATPGPIFWWLEFHPTDLNTMYTQGSRSTDNGDTWQGFSTGAMGLAIDPTNPNVIYGGSTLGVLKSTNGGTTWTNVNTGLEEVRVDGVAENPRDVNNYLIGAAQGYGFTPDNGASWTWPLNLSALPQPDMFGSAVAIEPSRFYLGGGGQAILGRSTDGTAWSAGNLQQVVQNDLGSSNGTGVGELGLAPGETGHVFAAVFQGSEGNPTPKGGVYESTDAGLTWRNTGLPAVPVNTIGFATTAAGTVIYAGVGDDHGRYAGAGGIYTSTVGDTSVWRQISISTTAPVISKLRVDPTNPLVVYAAGGFVDASDSSGRLNAALYKTTDGGATWQSIMPALQRVGGIRALAIDPAFTNNVYFSVESKVYQTVDGGATWSLFSSNDLGGEGINALIVPLPAPSPVVTFTAMATGGQNVLSWTNPGDSDFTGVVVKYSTQSLPMLSTEGITVTAAAGLPGATGVYTHTGVVSGTTYYYSVFSYNQAGHYSTPRQAVAQAGTAMSTLSVSLPSVKQAASGAARRPAAEASTSRNLYAAAGGGLFARSITGVQKIYIPYLPREFVAGW